MKNILKLLVVLAVAAMSTLSSCSKEDANVCPTHAVDVFRTGQADLQLHYSNGAVENHHLAVSDKVVYLSCELVKITGKALADGTCVRVHGALHYYNKGEVFEIYPFK